MKRWHLILLALASFGVFATEAKAQFVVSDPGTEAMTAATSAGVDTLNVGVETLNEGMRELIGHVSVPRATEDGMPTTPPSPAPALDNELYNSEAPTASPAATIYADGAKDLVGTDAEAALLREQLAGEVNAVGKANTDLTVLDSRLAASQATMAQLTSAPDLMQATVNVGVMAKRTHDATVMAARATYFNALVTSQTNLNQVKEAAEQREEHMRTFAIFGTGAAVP